MIGTVSGAPGCSGVHGGGRRGRARRAGTEALVELFYAPGTLLDEVARRLARHPEVVDAWSVEADANARGRTRASARQGAEPGRERA